MNDCASMSDLSNSQDIVGQLTNLWIQDLLYIIYQTDLFNQFLSFLKYTKKYVKKWQKYK